MLSLTSNMFQLFMRIDESFPSFVVTFDGLMMTVIISCLAAVGELTQTIVRVNS